MIQSGGITKLWHYDSEENLRSVGLGDEGASPLLPPWGIVSEPAATWRPVNGGIFAAWFVEADVLGALISI